MTNAEIAAALDELGVLYELDGAVRYRVLAYSTAAKAIRESPVSVEELSRSGRATEIPGVGKTLAEKIAALLETGEIPAARIPSQSAKNSSHVRGSFHPCSLKRPLL